MKLAKVEDIVLVSKNKKIEEIGKKEIKILNDLKKELEHLKVEALSANQCGINQNLLVIKLGNEIFQFANPTIMYRSGKVECLEKYINLDEQNEYSLFYNNRSLYTETVALNINNQLFYIRAIKDISALLEQHIEILNKGINVENKGRYIFETEEQREKTKERYGTKIIIGVDQELTDGFSLRRVSK